MAGFFLPTFCGSAGVPDARERIQCGVRYPVRFACCWQIVMQAVSTG